jgi:hypothetical protein
MERMARAHYEAAGVASWHWLDPLSRQFLIESMRAALLALSDPTEEMVCAGTEEWLCVRAQEDRAEVIWHAMIDAALADGEG